MSVISLLVLLLGILFLAGSGAGVFAWTVCAAAVGLAGSAFLIGLPSAAAGGPVPTPRGRSWAPWAFLAILGFLMLTLLPLPPRAAAFLGKERYTQNVKAVKAVERARDLGWIAEDGATPGVSFTRNRAGTMRIAVLAVAMFGAFALAARLGSAGARRLVRGVVAIGAAVAVAGCLNRWYAPQGDTLLWLIPIPHALPAPAACFMNRNHFGGYMALLLPAALALLADDLSKRRLGTAQASTLCVALLGAGVVASHSRGAVVAGATAFLAAAVLLFARRRVVLSFLVILLMAASAMAVLRFAEPEVLDRIGTLEHATDTPSFRTRVAAWRDTVAVWKAYPVAGVGANALRTVYPQHRRTTASGYLTHAENEYVQALAEGGLVGVALALLLAAALARDVRRAGGAADSVRLVAAGGALAVAAVHASLDFALSVPLYAVTLAALAGALAAPESPAEAEVGARAGFSGALAGVTAALVLCVWWGEMGALDSEADLIASPPEQLARAVVWAPPSAQAWYHLGRAASDSSDRDIVRFGERCLLQAAWYDRNNYRVWRELGAARLKLGNRMGARTAFARVKEIRAWVPVPAVPEK